MTEVTDLPQGGPQGERYERQRILGRGGQGIVFQAFDNWLGRAVAIKVLPSVGRKPQLAERLIREQQALSSLQGTAAVQVFDIYRGPNGELCLVMELLQGTDFEEHLGALEERGERLEPARIVELFDPIVDTLEIAHRAGILHRDLKPANLFLLESGGVRLLDFGMARLNKAAPLTAAGTVMGSPSYMAPEAWSGQSELVDHRADVYSLGVILFRVLAGEVPFGGQSLQEKFIGSTTQARPSLLQKRPDLPRDVDDWVALALAIDPEQRFANVRALWNAFLATFERSLPRARRPSLWAAAKDRLKEAFGGDQAESPAASERSKEPSFAREALARSVMNVNDPELTAELTDSAPPTPPLEVTVDLTSGELDEPPTERVPERALEKTLELSGSELIAREDTEPLPVAPAPNAAPQALVPAPPTRPRS